MVGDEATGESLPTFCVVDGVEGGLRGESSPMFISGQLARRVTDHLLDLLVMWRVVCFLCECGVTGEFEFRGEAGDQSVLRRPGRRHAPRRQAPV